jgi:hypothetical protein
MILEEKKEKLAEIDYVSHRTINGEGICIRFNINGKMFTRVSMLKDVGNFKKNQVLWWKDEDDNYCTYEQCIDLDGIIKAFAFSKEFKEQFGLEE